MLPLFVPFVQPFEQSMSEINLTTLEKPFLGSENRPRDFLLRAGIAFWFISALKHVKSLSEPIDMISKSRSWLLHRTLLDMTAYRSPATAFQAKTTLWRMYFSCALLHLLLDPTLYTSITHYLHLHLFNRLSPTGHCHQRPQRRRRRKDGGSCDWKCWGGGSGFWGMDGHRRR